MLGGFGKPMESVDNCRANQNRYIDIYTHKIKNQRNVKQQHMICTCVTSEVLDRVLLRTLGFTKISSSSEFSLESDIFEDEDEESLQRPSLTHRARSSSSSHCVEVKVVAACFQQVPDLEILLMWFRISINRIDRSPVALAVISL